MLKKSDIYAILDVGTCRNNISNLIINLIKNNIKIIQLRDKKSSWKEILEKAYLIKKIIKNKAIFIVNDYPEICLLANADGVHLGQDDLCLKSARDILGKDKIIGISCHNIKQAEFAQKGGADYIGFGPIFKTPTKRECNPIGFRKIKLIKNKIRIPFFAIGGIDSPGLKILKPLKIKRIAVCRALCKTKNTGQAIKNLRNLLN
ncbi:MAG: thiamine phosphate synthase [Candidatus Omnitrophica bacterium]|nr:thiamine phosphate synthase [Candidatus Omnitrophota bacterium]